MDQDRNPPDTKPDVDGTFLGSLSSPSGNTSGDFDDKSQWENGMYYPYQGTDTPATSFVYGSHSSSREGPPPGNYEDTERLHNGMRSTAGEVSSSSFMSPSTSSHRYDMHSPGLPEYTSLTSPNVQDFQFAQSLGAPSDGISSSALTKHMCAICGDRASGKHYGVYSCEGCKGFFKRTVRKELLYACRDDKNCIVDKRQRNRCQYCRYVKCLNTGMKREAVQEERQRAKERGEFGEVESSTSANSEMPAELILEAELATDPQLTNLKVSDNDNPMSDICQAADRQLFSLVDWAKRVPHFIDLPVQDQVVLLRAGWNELLIAGFSHRSTVVNDCILLATGVQVHRDNAHAAGVGPIFDRVLTELVAKMRSMAIDKTELGCLRAVVLFNPDAKGLKSIELVESLREKVYATLDDYCKVQYPDEPGRFAKLLLRLPALRSIGLKCIEHLFFFKLIGNTPLDSFLLEMLENSSAQE